MKIMTRTIVLCLFPIIGLLSIARANDKTIVKIGGDVIVEESEEVEDAVAIGGDVSVLGTVSGNAVAVGGSIYLGPNAVIREDAVSIGGTIQMEDGAEIYGDTVEIDDMGFVSHFIPSGKWDHWKIPWAFKIISFTGFLVLALIIILLLPNPINAAAMSIEKDIVTAILYSIAGVIIIVPLAIALAISVVGIPLIPLELLAVMLATLLGYISVAKLIGTRTLSGVNRPAESLITQTFTGLVILWLVGFVPFVGWLVKVIVLLIGFGGVIAAMVYSRKRQQISK